MASLKNTQKPDLAYLSSILANAIGDRGEEQFVSDYLSGIADCLKSKHGYYRSYGPYWPALKTMLIERELLPTGEVDDDVAEIYSFETDAMTVVAASLYQEMRFSEGVFYSVYHQLQVEGEDAPYEYYSYDLEQESE